MHGALISSLGKKSTQWRQGT
uniref:Uncharacterized protein n=1 Tax=Arundo donax TaxID=35708 RepID=A0A0A9CBA1_ARUDO